MLTIDEWRTVASGLSYLIDFVLGEGDVNDEAGAAKPLLKDIERTIADEEIYIRSLHSSGAMYQTREIPLSRKATCKHNIKRVGGLLVCVTCYQDFAEPETP